MIELTPCCDTVTFWESIVNADTGYREVVWVNGDFRLVDAESYERAYTSADGRPLASGYYVARWPAGTLKPHFLHDELTFEGPYPCRRSAEAALEHGHSSILAG